MESDVRGVSMLRAFGASDVVGAERLIYANLDAEAQEARQIESNLLDEFWAAVPDSLEEEKIARYAAIGYLVLTAYQLRNVAPASQPLISQRFTQSSVELYGEPKPDDVRKLMSGQYDSFRQYIDNPAIDQTRLQDVLATLDEALGGDITTAEVGMDDHHGVAEQMKTALNEHYGDVLELFDSFEQDGTELDLETVRSLFQEGIKRLVASDPDWQEWTVEITNGEGMSTIAKSKKVKIGNRGTYRPERLKALFTHEVLVHGLRSVNGHKTGDAFLGKGLPGNLDAEEGIGIFMEYAITGVVPNKIIDRYIDISLALGQTRLPALNRAQLHDFHANRQIVRAQAAGKTPDIAGIERTAWNHADRVYRGSLGNEIIGVNTKDIAYYQGFVKIANYLEAEITDGGKTPEDVFAYIMSGCFDPTDIRHQAYVRRLVDT
ncbi:MAG TPA: tyrosine/phenylalanine carboxypeptidase domain-containing protein [Verrucomicrobiae bacterium]|nr:tyrosine/phenylalanine carboxypeptidase domain-containing protein [Verrucomicrobiae bacterium]